MWPKIAVNVLQPLTEDVALARLREIVDRRHWSVAVVLLTGEIMVGRVLPARVPYTDVGQTPYAHYPASWGEPSDPSSATALWLKDIYLLYPSGCGSTSICELAGDQVAAIWPLGWKLDVDVSGITGTLGAALHASNEAAADRAGIRTFGFAAASLTVPRQVEVNGFWLESYEPFYIDYDYFQRLSTVGVSFGAFGVEAQYTRGVEATVKAALEDASGKLLGLTPPLRRYVGTIDLATGGETTEMQGGTFQLALFIRRTASVHGEPLPVLFQPTAVRYPLELWTHIRSPLTILAEDRQIPISSGDREWGRVLVPRAIGFIPA